MMKLDRRHGVGRVRQVALPGRPCTVTNRVLCRVLIIDDNADLAIFGSPTLGSIFKAEDSIDPTVTPAVRPNYYRGFRANEFAAYLQDDWRIRPRITLNLGLRWEYFGPPHNFQPGIDSNLFTGSNVTPFPYTPAAGSVANPFVH